ISTKPCFLARSAIPAVTSFQSKGEKFRATGLYFAARFRCQISGIKLGNASAGNTSIRKTPWFAFLATTGFSLAFIVSRKLHIGALLPNIETLDVFVG